MSQYPEHDKLHAVRNQSQPIGEFLDWMGESGYTICEYRERGETYWPVRKGIQAMLAEYFDIDQDKLEKEKEQMLDEIRSAK